MPLWGVSGGGSRAGSQSPMTGYYGQGHGYAGSGYGGDSYGGNYGDSSRYQTQELTPSSSRRYDDGGFSPSRYESLNNWQGAGLSRSRSGLPSSRARDRAAARSRDQTLPGPGLSRYSGRPDAGARHMAVRCHADDPLAGPGLFRHSGSLSESARSRAANRNAEGSLGVARSRSHRYADESSHGYASADFLSADGTRAREQRAYARTGNGGFEDPFQASLNAERSRGFGYGSRYGDADGHSDRLSREAHNRKHDLGDRYRNFDTWGGRR